MAMIRKQIYLDAATNKRLKAEAKRRKMSEAAIIRERLGAGRSDLERADAARGRLAARFRFVAETAGSGPGTGRTFDRDEIYAKRRAQARPDRHQHPDKRNRPA